MKEIINMVKAFVLLFDKLFFAFCAWFADAAVAMPAESEI